MGSMLCSSSVRGEGRPAEMVSHCPDKEKEEEDALVNQSVMNNPPNLHSVSFGSPSWLTWSTPSTSAHRSGATPASRKRVGNQSAIDIKSRRTAPRSWSRGDLTNAGAKMPPSQYDPFHPRSGKLLPPKCGSPL